MNSVYKQMTPAMLIQRASENVVSEEFDKNIIEFMVEMPDLLNWTLEILLEDFDYYRNPGSNQAIAARGLAAFSYRLNQVLSKLDS